MGLRLVRVRETHIEQIRRWRTSEDVTKYMYTDPRIGPEDQHRWFDGIVQDRSRMDWVISLEGSDVGVVSLYDIVPCCGRCSLARYLGEESARGRGTGTAVVLNILHYVFECLNLHRVHMEAFEWNDAAVKANLKFGARIEGTLRDHVWKNGRYHNVVCQGLLREDWENNVRHKMAYRPAEIEEWEEKARLVSLALPSSGECISTGEWSNPP